MKKVESVGSNSDFMVRNNHHDTAVYCSFLLFLFILFIIYLFYLYIYPPESQESDGGANRG